MGGAYFLEVHERYRLLAPGELAELVKAVSTLDFHGENCHFFKRVGSFGEFIYLYWAKYQCRKVLQKPGRVSIPSSFAGFRRQLVTRVMPAMVWQIQAQIEEALMRIVNGGGFNPATCAPLTPIEVFWKFLQARCPRWQAYSFTELAAFLFAFVQEKNPTYSISVFSGYMGLSSRSVRANIKKFNRKRAHPEPGKDAKLKSLPPRLNNIIGIKS